MIADVHRVCLFIIVIVINLAGSAQLQLLHKISVGKWQPHCWWASATDREKSLFRVKPQVLLSPRGYASTSSHCTLTIVPMPCRQLACGSPQLRTCIYDVRYCQDYCLQAQQFSDSAKFPKVRTTVSLDT